MNHEQQLQKYRYRLWVKAGLALKYLKDGIENFVDDEIESLHNTIYDDVRDEIGKSDVTCDECHIDTLLPAHDPARCTQGYRCFCRNHQHKRRSCPNNNLCGRILDKIVEHHMYGTPSWSNTDSTKWCENRWEIAKCFLDGGGYKDKGSAADTDCKGLLSIVTNNMFVQKSVDTAIDKIEPITDVFSKSKEARNEILHKASLELTDEQLKNYISVMTQVLKDKGKLKEYAQAEQAIVNLTKLEQDNLIISTKDEWEIRDSALKAIQEKKQQALDEIDERKAEKENFEKLQTQIAQLQETLTALSTTSSRQESLENRLSVLESMMSQMKQFQTETPKEIMDLQKDMADLKSRLDASSDIEALHRKKLIYLEHKKELRKELINLYSKYLSTITVSPPLRRLDASVDDFYMELEIVDDLVYERHENKRSGDIIKYYREIFFKDPLIKGTKVKTETKFEKLTKEFRVENIYVLGDAGAGKSTWCLKLINMWLQGQTENETKPCKGFTPNEKMMHEFDVVFFVSLRHASQEIDLIEMIGNQIFFQTPQLLEYSKSILMEEPEKCIVIVDGLDEWNPPDVHVSSPFGKTSKLPGRHCLNHCTVLTTSRPWKLNEVKPSYDAVDRAVIIRGFERESSIRILSGKVINKLVEKEIKPATSSIEGEGKKVEDFEYEVKKLFNMTTSKSNYPDLMKIPLILIFMVLRWYEDGALERTMTGNYLYLIENILDHEEGYQHSKSRYGQRSDNDYKGRLSRISDIGDAKTAWSAEVNNLPKCMQKATMCAQYGGLLLKLSKIAFDGLFDGQGNHLVFDEKTILEKLNEKGLEVSVKSGILSKTCVVGGYSYELSKLSFLHKTVQEYMAAVYITASMKKDEIGPLQKFKEFCSTYSKIYEMENVIMFLCGLDNDIGIKVINHVSLVENDRMSINEYDHISTHFYFKCFKEFKSENDPIFQELPLNSFVLEHWDHSTDFLELLSASSDTICFGKFSLLYEPGEGQPNLVEYFLSRKFAFSNLTTLVLESITFNCSDKAIKVFEFNNLKNLHLSSLNCKSVSDCDKDIPCCVVLDFLKSTKLKMANIYNVSRFQIALSGIKLEKMRLEDLLSCHIQVDIDRKETEKVGNAAIKEDINTNNNIDLIDIKHNQLSELVCKIQSFEHKHEFVQVARLNFNRNKEFKLNFDRYIEIREVFLSEMDTFPILEWQNVRHVHIKQEDNDIKAGVVSNVLKDLAGSKNLTSLKVKGSSEDLGTELQKVIESACNIESLGMTFREFSHYCQTSSSKIQEIQHLTLNGISTKTSKTVKTVKDTQIIDSDNAEIKPTKHFEKLRYLTCKGLNECDFVSLKQCFSYFPLLQKLKLELSNLKLESRTEFTILFLKEFKDLKVLSLTCLTASVLRDIVSTLSTMSDLKLSDLLLELYATVKQLDEEVIGTIETLSSLKCMNTFTLKNNPYLDIDDNFLDVTNIDHSMEDGKRKCMTYKYSNQSGFALKMYILDGFCIDEISWEKIVESMSYRSQIQTVKLLNTRIASEDTENQIKSSSQFGDQTWECTGRESYNIILKKAT